MVALRAGDLVDERFRVTRSIGSGGMASVFEVQDLSTGRREAMKVLHPQLLQHPVIPQRFLREAQAASALVTPFAVKVEGTGNLADGTPYIVMEYLEGQPLDAIIAQQAGPFEAERVLYLADQVAQGIEDAHARGIIHRDLKPENIFVIPGQQGDLVKVVDFGISKIFSGEDGVKLTQTGVTVGTPQYMPVEQLRGRKDLDGRVDVYALGVVIFQMLAGVRPYDGFTYEEVILKVATTTAPSLSAYRPDLPPELVRVVDTALARDRDERIASMHQLREAVAPFWSRRGPVGTGAPLRATAGRTHVMEDSAPPGPMVSGLLVTPPPPPRTMPDRPAPEPPLPASAGPASPPYPAPPANPARSSNVLVLLLLIAAAGLFGLLIAVALVAWFVVL